MLVAQVLSTNAFYRAVMQERGLEPAGSTETGRNNADTFASSTRNNDNSNRNGNNNPDEIAMLEKMIRALQQEVDELKRGGYHY